ncbi:MAG: DUF423 domain-containing protein [Caulobacteraceae bacterium]
MTLAPASGLIGVLAGAFAAHGVSDPVARSWLETGARYELIHALATAACAAFVNAGGRRARLAPGLFLAGTVLFSGSLYAMAFGAPRWLGAVTPLGGLLFIAGWAVLIAAGLQVERGERPVLPRAGGGVTVKTPEPPKEPL